MLHTEVTRETFVLLFHVFPQGCKRFEWFHILADLTSVILDFKKCHPHCVTLKEDIVLLVHLELFQIQTTKLDKVLCECHLKLKQFCNIGLLSRKSGNQEKKPCIFWKHNRSMNIRMSIIYQILVLAPPHLELEICSKDN